MAKKENDDSNENTKEQDELTLSRNKTKIINIS